MNPATGKTKAETKAEKNRSSAQVIAFPARTALIGGRQLHFLFSVRQVVDVLKLVQVQPFAAEKPYARGMADWRGRSVPVLCLEQSLGLKLSESGMPQRNIVVRGVLHNEREEGQDLFAVCEVGAAARQFQLPAPCEPVVPPEHMPGVALLKGMYAMDEYLFMVVDLEKIVAGLYPGGIREAGNGA